MTPICFQRLIYQSPTALAIHLAKSTNLLTGTGTRQKIDKNEKQMSKLKIVFYCIVKQVTYIDNVLLSRFDRILEFHVPVSLFQK